MHYKTAIIGGTFLGLGYGLSHTEDSVLIESSGSLGWEFIDAMNARSSWSAMESLPKLSSDYFTQMKERNILTNDKVHLPAMAPLLFQFLKDSKLKYHFLTHIVSVNKVENNFEIKLYNQNGFSTIYAEQILDTTNLGYRQTEKKSNQYISATLHSGSNTDHNFSLSGSDFKIIKGNLLSEAFLQIEIDVSAAWDVARKKIHDFWIDRPAALKEWELASVATRLDVLPVNSKGWSKDNFTWLPGVSFENPLLAMSKGEMMEFFAEVVA
ncbi:MAG: hypothetical protein COA79_10495 [Planctomycetota bacterium]|nr:MAG: hypothetical protein COA79_10495 [Planctomycetota bacterium]